MPEYGFERGGRIVDTGAGGAFRLLGAVAGVVVLLILIFSGFTTIGTGHVGVLTRFGKVTGRVLPEGLHLKNPIDRVHEMSVRTQELTERASVPSNEGLIVSLDTSLLLRLDREEAPSVLRTVGANYIEVVVQPNLRSAIRSVTAAHSANALYSSAREKVAQEIRAELEKELTGRGIVIESVLLRDIQLPQTLKASIEAKQQAEQESLAMAFRLQKEKQEAERKRIEAQGIKDFQKIVSQGIDERLLRWKGIEATEKLATSTNSKVVVIGSPKDGLPLILGQ